MAFKPDETSNDARGAHYVTTIGLLRPGVTVAQADAEMRVIAAQLAAQYPKSNKGWTVFVMSVLEYSTRNVRVVLYTLLGAVGCVLLIACANIANLLLVRAAGRETEIAVRTALGAGRGRIVRQMVTESVLLSIVGAVAGMALAAWVVDAIVAFGPQGLPRLEDIVIDGRVLGFSVAIAILTGVLFGLVPAFHAARGELGQRVVEGLFVEVGPEDWREQEFRVGRLP